MKKFGLIGFPLGHSFSKKYFTEKFEREEISDCSYELYPLENIEDVRFLFEVEKELCGLNVTIPYKEKIIEYLDGLDSAAQQIGAVNCIHMSSNGKTGYNTDWLGFRDALKPLLQKHHTHALILGTGGSSKAVAYALMQLNITHYFVSRNKTEKFLGFDELEKELLQQHTIIINTSPLGMHPATESYPALPYEYISSKHLCFDLVYNPEETVFLQKAKQQGAVTKSGLEMLQLQAEYAWKIWNEQESE